MKNKRRPKIKKLTGLLLVCLVLLAACSDQAAVTPTPPGSPGGIVPGVTITIDVISPSAGPALVPTTLPAVPPTATPALPTAVPVTPTPVADAQANAVLEKISQATRKMSADARTFRYRLQQTGQLDSGGSVSAFEAAGSGEFQRPAFHQLLTLKVSGQEQEIELYGNQSQLFQRVTGLVAWRKVEPVVAGPYPALVQAQDFKSAGAENLDNLKTTRYGWTFPAGLLLPTSGQPEGLGALSITNLYQAFTNDKTGQAQATIWVDDATGYIARYQVTAALSSGSAKLSYTATYDYAEFDSGNVKVDVPGDLPK
jgi:hypothetical protein